jgi:hypothetical protein
MIKFCALLPFTLLLVSCTTIEDKSDYGLRWDKDSVRLVIVDENGKPIPAFAGKYIGVQGYIFSQGQIRMHPGKKRIGFICPRVPDAPEILDVAPSIEYEFKAGNKYEIACRNGWPAVRQLNT